MSPRVSVIVPTYNGESFVRETLESVLAQTWRDFELIVCDDGSTDGTLAILDEYRDQLRVVRQSNQGVAAARNRAALEARGEYLAFLDHDDLWEPELLATLVPLLDARPECGLVYADAWIIDSNGESRGRRGTFLAYAQGEVFDALLLGNFIPVETTLLRARVFKDLLGCDTSLRYLEDYELCLRVARRGPVAFHPEPLARYRIHDRNLSHELEPMLVEWLRVLDSLPQRVGELTPEQDDVVAREHARLCVDLAWRALRRQDLPAADAWMGRSEGRGPFARRTRVRILRTLLALLPRAAGAALLRRLPRRKLYGVSVPPSDESAVR